MPRSKLKLKKLVFDKAAADPVAAFLQISADVALVDATGAVLFGAPAVAAEKFPIQVGDEILGWTVGGAHAQSAAQFLTYLAGKELEKIALADEVLDKYREINLLFNLSERLGASLDLTTVSNTIFNEAKRLISATSGEIILFDERGTVQNFYSFGESKVMGRKPWDTVVARVSQSGKGEIVNAESGETQTPPSTLSFMCAPLKAKQRVTGVIVLAEQAATNYTAGDLKFLNTVASQASPSIENALLYEKTLREAREREEKLQRQIDELRIQIDETRLSRQVAEITETDYFQMLREKADRLRFGADK